MFETGIRQFQMAMAMVWGKPINPSIIERLVQDGLKTLDEFGTLGDEVQPFLEGPFVDSAVRRSVEIRALQRTLRHLMHFSPYYRKLFTSLALDPEKFTVDDMLRVPVTQKQTLQDRQQDFLCTHARPHFAARTTGTTGRPAEVWFSKYEIELWPALTALGRVLINDTYPQDCAQINISSRAISPVQRNMMAYRLLGTRIRMLGIISPEESVESLLNSGEQAPTILNTYPSYLAQLVHVARRRGLGPHDFHLRQINCGGEILSSALTRAAQETFGPTIVNDTFGMTEILPVTGRTCHQGHLHYDLNMGFVEVIDLETSEPAAPGALGTIVVSPYYPYRECMPVFRYDTHDVVRRLPDEHLTCDLAMLPATSHILGKAEHLLYMDRQVVTPRELIEVLEALPSHPWPARFRIRVVDNQIELVVPEQTLNGITKEEVERRFQASGIPLGVIVCTANEREVTQLRPLRADLLEATFVDRRN